MDAAQNHAVTKLLGVLSQVEVLAFPLKTLAPQLEGVLLTPVLSVEILQVARMLSVSLSRLKA